MPASEDTEVTNSVEIEKNDNKSNGKEEEDKEVDTSHDPYYAPIITLPEVEVKSGEEEEDVLFKMRAKLFRYDSGDGTEENPAQWKERGTGDVKFLKHQKTGAIRLLMRRDKTLKLCANHAIQPWMLLRPNCGSDRAFVWSVHEDYADEEAKTEMLAIRFANADNAKKFKAQFQDSVKEETRRIAQNLEKSDTGVKLAEMVKKVEISSTNDK